MRQPIVLVVYTKNEGAGALFDEAKAKRIVRGGFIIMPAKVIRYAFTKEECIIQVQGYGPSVRTFVTTGIKSKEILNIYGALRR